MKRATVKQMAKAILLFYKEDVKNLSIVENKIKFHIAERRMGNISNNIPIGWNTINVFKGSPETPKGVKRWRPANVIIGPPHSFPSKKVN